MVNRNFSAPKDLPHRHAVPIVAVAAKLKKWPVAAVAAVDTAVVVVVGDPAVGNPAMIPMSLQATWGDILFYPIHRAARSCEDAARAGVMRSQ